MSGEVEVVRAGCFWAGIDPPAVEAVTSSEDICAGSSGGGPSAQPELDPETPWPPLTGPLSALAPRSALPAAVLLQSFGLLRASIARLRSNTDHVCRVEWVVGPRALDGKSGAAGGGIGRTSRSALRGAMMEVLGALRRVWVEDVAAANDVRWDQVEGVLGDKDTRTISDLYNTLPSPSLDVDDVGRIKDPRVRRAVEGLLEREGEGMRSRLYGYQAMSVARMLLAESAPGRLLDPTFVALRDAHGGTYHLDLVRGAVRREVGWYDLPRGGILCEEMGTGKTIISLALIFADIDTLAAPPPSLVPTPVYTPASLRLLPPTSPEMDDFAERTHYDSLHCSARRQRPSMGPPPLVDLCLHVQRSRWARRTTPAALARRPDWALSTDMEARLTANRPFYHPTALQERQLATRIHDHRPERTRQRPGAPYTLKSKVRPAVSAQTADCGPGLGPRMYLTSATLLVVPSLLVHQWRAEVQKHLEDGAVHMLIVSGGAKEPLPQVEDMLDADIVLISDGRLRAEASAITVNEIAARGSCRASPLTQIRWKRIMIDEGHYTSSSNNDLVRLVGKLSCERRWVISGTPTKHLLGSVAETEVDQAVREEAIDHSLPPNSWSAESLDDLNRLGTIMAGFLAMQPFKSEANFAELVSGPVRGDANGPTYGAVQRVANLMGAVMIRNRTEDIATEMPLPPLTSQLVDLEFGRYGAMTYNVLQALVAVNVVTSQGTDVDYLLHKRNVKHLRQALSNLSLAAFWFSGDHLDVSGPLFVIDNHLRDRIEKGYTPEECEILQKARMILDQALQDPVWSHLMLQRSLPALAHLEEEGLLDAWVPRGLARSGSFASLLPVEQALRFCETLKVLHAELGDDMQNSWRGKLQGAGFAATRSLAQQLEAKQDGQNRQHPSASGVGDAQDIKPGRALLDSAKRSHDRASSAGPASSPRKHQIPPSPQLTDCCDSGLPEMSLKFSTLSSKVNWILAEILRCTDDVFVIFSQDVAILGYLTEALDLVGVDSCYVGYGIKSREAREESLLLFQDGEARVCLMDLALASRGLNLVVANRVIFTEPVWRRDVEAQAVKRIHRIGQQRATQSHTLYMLGTQEEIMVRRRATTFSHTLEDDETLRESIKRPNFVQPGTAEPAMLEVILNSGTTTRSSHMPLSGSSRSSERPVITRQNEEELAPPTKRARFA